jgi:hypothetical protein
MSVFLSVLCICLALNFVTVAAMRFKPLRLDKSGGRQDTAHWLSLDIDAGRFEGRTSNLKECEKDRLRHGLFLFVPPATAWMGCRIAAGL